MKSRAVKTEILSIPNHTLMIHVTETRGTSNLRVRRPCKSFKGASLNLKDYGPHPKTMQCVQMEHIDT